MAHVITPISRLLVANRGEIARRINRTAEAMGISTVAIYADGDVNAPFVLEADTAIALNGKSMEGKCNPNGGDYDYTRRRLRYSATISANPLHMLSTSC